MIVFLFTLPSTLYNNDIANHKNRKIKKLEQYKLLGIGIGKQYAF